MFHPVESSVSFPKLEEDVLRFWKRQKIYEKTLQARTGAPPFVFYEGPPTANGLPHPGHCLTRAIKDLFPRYKTMRGYLCERKGGWDTHGLPVEVEVCKELGIHSKEEIEQYGVEPFIRRCLESVFRYTREWEELTDRLGFWIHLDEAYVTYHQSYIESVWWALKNLFDRGLLYQGHKIVWWWAQGGTALSSGEVGQGYREVADPSVFVRFPLVDAAAQGHPELADADLLVWTTTPWTLPSNQFAAVRPGLEYSLVAVEGEPRKLVLASALVEEVAAKSKRELAVEATCAGEQLLGLRYRPPFSFYYDRDGERTGTLKRGGKQHVAWRVVAAEFVTVDAGTGVVHQAPAFGEVDYDVLLAEQARFVEGEGPPLICSVAPDGTFTSETPEFEGRWVKEADGDICRDLKARGLLFHWEQYLHDYPFCWRAEEDPLIQYPRKSWFIRTTAFKDRMLENNARINWLPEHIRDGRFGNFLETNVDWALSRERYWGTPLPIWVCEETGHMEAVGSYDELLAKPGLTGTEVWEQAKQENPDLPEHLKVHKPYIDAITYDSPKANGARMRRVPEVIDCWFDSGAMPFAQWGYPQAEGSAERFRSQFPADFISEALDQTRGWFYSLLAISTLLFSEEGGGTGGSGLGARDRTGNADTVPSPQSPTRPGAATPRRLPPAAPMSPSPESPAPSPESRVHHSYPYPYRTCIVLGLMLAEWWESADGKQIFLIEEEAREACGNQYVHRVGKMSKSKRNYREPQEIFRRYGADALRWYFFSNQPPWTSIQYSERAIKDCIPEFLLRLWHTYSFFVIYANIDGFDPAAEIEGPAGQLDAEVLSRGKSFNPASSRRELDRWIVSELARTVTAVTERMDAYDNYAACGRLNEFVDALSNWFVRLSRDRFWSGEKSRDKADAYWTLYECLLTVSKLVAPFVPFLAEGLWQNLAVAAFAGRPEGERPVESVHLCDYPQAEPGRIDEVLSERMALAREIVSLGRSARMTAKLKVRQPLALVEVILADRTHQPWLEEHARLIAGELNVKEVQFTQQSERYITYAVLPDLKKLGPKLGRRLPALRKLLAEADGGRLLSEMEANGQLTLELPDGPITLQPDEIQIRLQAKPGWAAAQGRRSVVVLSTELTPELVAEGLARELVRVIQDRRKEMQLEFTNRIRVGIATESVELRHAVDQFGDYIKTETLAVELEPVPGSGSEQEQWEHLSRLMQDIESGVPSKDLRQFDVRVANEAAQVYIEVVRPEKQAE